MPTDAQLESRNQVKEFLQRVASPLRSLSSTVRSKWFDKTDEELNGWIERGRAISEIKDSLGYKYIMQALDSELNWTQAKFENCDPADMLQLQCCVRSLKFVRDYIISTERKADVSASVLAGRPNAIARDTVTFIKNARVEGADDASSR